MIILANLEIIILVSLEISILVLFNAHFFYDFITEFFDDCEILSTTVEVPLLCAYVTPFGM